MRMIRLVFACMIGGCIGHGWNLTEAHRSVAFVIFIGLLAVLGYAIAAPNRSAPS